VSRLIHAAVYVALLLLAYSFYGWAATIIAACLIFYIVELRANVAALNRIALEQCALAVKQLRLNEQTLIWAQTVEAFTGAATTAINSKQDKPANAGQNQKDQEDLKCN